MSKINDLEVDRKRLRNSIDRIEDKLKEIDACGDTGGDPSLVTTLIESKGRAEALLSQKENELKIEKENSKLRTFGGVKMNASDIAKLSIGGSLKTSSLDKNSVNDETKKRIIDEIFKTEADAAKRSEKLLEEGFIVQRHM